MVEQKLVPAGIARSPALAIGLLETKPPYQRSMPPGSVWNFALPPRLGVFPARISDRSSHPPPGRLL